MWWDGYSPINKSRAEAKEMTTAQAKAFLSSEFADLISLALEYVSLSRRQREILKLRCIEGLTIEDTADELDTSVSTVKKIEREALNRCAVVWDNSSWIKAVIERGQ